MKKTNNKKFLIALTVAIVLPFSFYIIAKVKKKDHLNMPKYYGISTIDTLTKDGKQRLDTNYKTVADILLTNQMGDTVSLNHDLNGKMLLVEVFFTNCTSICPILTNNISYFLHKAFKKNDTTVHFVSISIDPAKDSLPVLKAYAQKYKANPDHWWFLTGDRSLIHHYLYQELKLMLKQSGNDTEILEHTPTLVLIDKDRYIRGYYNGLDTLDLKKCADDIGLISMQKRRKK